jgi:outer membrane biogenesis lipoprotein LolB
MKKTSFVLSLVMLLLLQGCALKLQKPNTLTVNVDPEKTKAVVSTATVSCHSYFLFYTCALNTTLTEVR